MVVIKLLQVAGFPSASHRWDSRRVGPRTLGYVAATLALLLVNQALDVHAQVHVGADVAFSTEYVWRGITRTENLVIQPDLYVATAPGRGFLTFGWWANIDPLGADEHGAGDPEVADGRVRDFDLWAEYSTSSRTVDAALGWVRYDFDENGSVEPGSARLITNEVYGRVQLMLAPLDPKLAVWYDVDKVKGAYIEGSLDLRVPLLPLRLGPITSFHAAGLFGWSIGQEVNDARPSEAAHFAGRGLTHIDLSLWSSFFVAEEWSVTPAFHFQINDDPATRRRADDAIGDSDTKLWFILYVSWGHQITAGEESR